jgi:hypothetical protein
VDHGAGPLRRPAEINLKSLPQENSLKMRKRRQYVGKMYSEYEPEIPPDADTPGVQDHDYFSKG